ncbi:hypothetical protein ZIOFF_048302 [Zingiber officinale]|uniref:Aminotransferase class I/classII large domain-containing protein n=1 Tax=Zingiber officinale TaxID=94328 RepID=A0A8J5FUV3_ZINOF|nr:hypothetical protein ZIOFF_048302 [Zingiber officinale]
MTSREDAPAIDKMEAKLSKASRALNASPIQEISHLAQRCGAINLAEGFPDFPAPPHVKHAAVAAIAADLNQYRHVQGICDLLAVKMKQNHVLDFDPLTDFVICCGQSEAFAATILATIDQGDEVLIFDPAYETYESCIILAGGIPVYVPLDPPYWTLNVDKFMRSFTGRTKAVVLNRSFYSPHNPTGKVFSKEELEVIAAACCQMDCLAITDESTLPIPFLLWCLQILQLGGFYDGYCWRIGWACAPTAIASAIRNIHIKVTDSAPAPFQEAALAALQSPPEYFSSLKADYVAKRNFLIKMLSEVGFQVHNKPQGSVFIFAELPKTCLLSDVSELSPATFPFIDFVKELIEKAGVAAVPGRGFFHGDCNDQTQQSRYVRFAFCKSNDTLSAADQKMRSCVGK